MFFDRFDLMAMGRRFHGPWGGHPRFAGRRPEVHAASDPWGDGPGPHFGRHRGGGHGGRGGWGGRGGGRVFGQGGLRLIVLHLIAESPRHGYELIKAIEDGFGGQYAPSPGAIYPTLTLLEEQDLIEPVNDSADGKKRYRVTAAGRAWLEANRETVDGVTARMRMAARAMAGDAVPERVLQAMHTLKHALLLRRGPWSDAEVDRVAQVIQAAADGIVSEPAADTGDSRP
jgi:DNA-binding PadR family transcriptional regulator